MKKEQNRLMSFPGKNENEISEENQLVNKYSKKCQKQLSQKQENKHNKTKKAQNLVNNENLLAKITELQAQNKRLKSRLADFQPQKQKVLRPPNSKKTKELFSNYKTKKIALKICYLGFSYDGMAYQQDLDNTVQSYIFKVLHTLSLIQNQTPGGDYTRAGRTDKGVSAMGNVISLRLRSNQEKQGQKNKLNTKAINYCQMMNALLPEDIRILASQEVNDQFNARYWCTQRSYKYFFPKNGMNIEAMKQSIKYFEGTHNFINFCKINLTNTVNFERIIFKAEIKKSNICEIYQNDANQIYYFHFVGNSFLWHQIRFMSAILFLVGNGKQQPDIVKNLLDIQKYPRKPNYPMAPQYPLILEDCEYPQVKLTPKKQTVFQFYETFNQIIMRKSVEKTLVINCIMMAQRDLIKNGEITMEFYLQELRNKTKNIKFKSKRLELHKSSGRSLEQAVSSLKGKKKELFQKKKQKQEEYEKQLQIKSQLEQKADLIEKLQ